MSPELSHRYQRYIELLDSFPFREEELDYGVLNRHLPFLERMDEVGNSAISVFDLYRREHVYTSPRYRERLGIPGSPSDLPVEGGLDGLMHPDDLLLVPAGIWLTVRLIPPDLLAEFRTAAAARERPTSVAGAVAIGVVWIGFGGLLAWLWWRR